MNSRTGAPLTRLTGMVVSRSSWRADVLTRFSKNPVSHFLDCGEGWKDVICDLVDALDATEAGYKIAQVKQKWGGLRVYVEPKDPDCDVFQPLLDQAEERSFTVCENCGASATSLGNGRCVETRCAVCVGVHDVRRS